jgi:hypothetical protein
MPNKYYGRSISNISRDNGAVERSEREPSWFGDFLSNLEKNSVKSKRDSSMVEQINNILGNKSKYSNVEEAILDMQKRTGLFDFLQSKRASDESEQEPEIFQKIPAMKTYIDNFVDQHPGANEEAVALALLEYQPVRSQLPESHDVSREVKEYISKKIAERKSRISRKDEDSMQLGKIDLHVDDNTTEDNDPFSGCMPNTDSLK